MAERVSMSKVRAASGTADQVFSSLSNGLIIYAVAVVTTTDFLGQIALLLTLLAAAIGVLRGALGTSLLLTAGRAPSDIRREGAFAFTSALLVSPIVGAIMWAVEGPDMGLPVILIIVATPIVLVEDVLRYVAIAQGRPHVAALWDGVWFAGSAALWVTTWLRMPAATTTSLIGGWTGLAFVALVGMLASVRVGPRFRHYRAWISDGWQHRVRYGTDAGLEQTAVFVVLLLAALVLSPAISATLRGATALLAPVAIATNAIPLVLIPESKRLHMPPQQVWSALSRIASVSSSGTILVGVALFLLPRQFGELFLGGTFEEAQAIIPIIAFEYAIVVWAIAVIIFLRTFNRSADALALKLNYALAMPALAVGGGLLSHTAAGVAVGVAAAATFIAALALIRVRPWAASVVADQGTITRAVPKLIATKSLPLVTTLRLHESMQLSAPLATVWTFVVFAMLVPAAIIRLTPIPTSSTWLWSLPAIALSATRLAQLIGNGERRLFETMFWGYSYVFLGLAPFTQLRAERWPGTVPRVDDTFVGPATVIVLIGCVAFLAGARLDNATSLRSHWQALSISYDTKSRAFTISYGRTVALCVFAILLNFYYLSHVGWLQFLMSRDEVIAANNAVWPVGSPGVVVLPCTFMSLLVAFIALIRFRREAKRARICGNHIPPAMIRSSTALLGIIGILLMNSMNPISTARYLSGTAMLAVATAFGLFASSRNYRITVWGFVGGLLLIFPLADAFRMSLKADFKATNLVDSLLSGDYDSFAQIMNGYLSAEREGIIPGKQFSGVLLFWVRRALWPDKPIDTGVHIANVRGYPFTNLSAPLWIEFYMNGGWILLVLGMFALGFGLHRWDTRLNSQIQTDGMPSLIGCILPFYMLILLRGSLLQASAFLFFIVTFSLFVRQRRRIKAQPRPPEATLQPQALASTQHEGTTYVTS